jgi:hypothetical protein
MMEAANTSVKFYKTTWRNIPEEVILNIFFCFVFVDFCVLESYFSVLEICAYEQIVKVYNRGVA